MPGVGHVAFQIDGRVAEQPSCERAGGLDFTREPFGRRHHPHTDAAAAGGSFDQERISDVLRRADGIRAILARETAAAGKHRHARLNRDRPRPFLVAHRLDGVGRRPDPGETGRRDRLREGCVLSKKAIAGVDRAGLRARRRRQHRIGVQVALQGRRGTDLDGFVGHLHMQRVAVGLGMDRDGRDTHLPAGAYDPAGDLAPVRDENLACIAH